MSGPLRLTCAVPAFDAGEKSRGIGLTGHPSAP